MDAALFYYKMASQFPLKTAHILGVSNYPSADAVVDDEIVWPSPDVLKEIDTKWIFFLDSSGCPSPRWSDFESSEHEDELAHLWLKFLKFEKTLLALPDNFLQKYYLPNKKKQLSIRNNGSPEALTKMNDSDFTTSRDSAASYDSLSISTTVPIRSQIEASERNIQVLLDIKRAREVNAARRQEEAKSSPRKSPQKFRKGKIRKVYPMVTVTSH